MNRDLNALPLPDLFTSLIGDGSLDRLLDAAIREDLGEAGDITSEAIVPPGTQATASLNLRQAATVAGLATVPHVLAAFPGGFNWVPETSDGIIFDEPVTLGHITGSLGHLMGVERTLLNLVGRLCGVATLTQAYVEATTGNRAVICDTRKTTPGLRSLEKYAVSCGGGTLHRIGLFDAVLIKDNHLAGIDAEMPAANVAAAAHMARQAHPELQFVEVEVDTLEQLEEMMRCPEGLIDIILLDNMSLDELIEAVVLRNANRPDLLLEASGRIALDTVREVAETGVDRISVGALTHQATSVDIGLDIGLDIA